VVLSTLAEEDDLLAVVAVTLALPVVMLGASWILRGLRGDPLVVELPSSEVLSPTEDCFSNFRLSKSLVVLLSSSRAGFLDSQGRQNGRSATFTTTRRIALNTSPVAHTNMSTFKCTVLRASGPRWMPTATGMIAVAHMTTAI
jgi:hypothetical protein